MFQLTPEDLQRMQQKVQENKAKDPHYSDMEKSEDPKMFEDHGDKDDMLDRKYPYRPE